MVLVLLLVDVSQRVKSFEITFTQQIVVRTDLEIAVEGELANEGVDLPERERHRRVPFEIAAQEAVRRDCTATDFLDSRVSVFTRPW